MAFLGGIGDSQKGLGFSAAQAPIGNPVAPGQLDTAYQNTQTGLAQQQAFLNALQAQNGIQNQSNVYNQLAGVANGEGPNPAKAQLAQATAANTANQAALQAGQRGAGQNVGLIARQAAQQGAANQQAAAGQAASLQANQSLNALGQMSNIAGQQVGQQGNAITGYNQLAQNEQGNLLNATGSYNNALVGATSNQNTINAGVNSDIADEQSSALKMGTGAGMAAAGARAKPTPKAHGGVIRKMADGGAVSNVGMHLSGDQVQVQPIVEAPQGPAQSGGGGDSGPDMGQMMQLAMMARGGRVPAMLSPGEMYLPPEQAKAVARGSRNPMAAGTKIPGQAKVKGDSPKNDTVPAELEEGGVVIPRSVMQSKDPKAAAARFVAAHLKGLKKSK